MTTTCFVLASARAGVSGFAFGLGLGFALSPAAKLPGTSSSASAARTSANSAGERRGMKNPLIRRRRTARSLPTQRVVHPELVAQLVADLADRAVRAERLAHRGQEVLVPARRAP